MTGGGDRFDATQPPGLPGWPYWSVSDDGRTLTVYGRHLTAAGYRRAGRAAAIASLIVLIFPAWFYWGWQNRPPYWLQQAMTTAADRAGLIPDTMPQSELAARYFPMRNPQHSVSFVPWKWGCVALWIFAWFFIRIIRRGLAAIFRPFTWRRSAVMFTREKIGVSRRWRLPEVVDLRTAEITFIASPLADVQWRQLKTQQRGQVELGIIYGQTQNLCLQFGKAFVWIGEFANPIECNEFLHVSQAALNFTQQAAGLSSVTVIRRF